MATLPTPKKKSKVASRVAMVVAAPILLFVGIGIGSSGGDAAPVPVPGPTVTVTETPAPIVKTETKTVTETPDVCLEALDLADQANQYASEGFGYAGDAMTAAGSYDVDGLTAANREIGELTPKYQGTLTQYVLSADQCRQAGK